MGKSKKRNHPDVEEILARPWCYYCERDFDDLKILISHQKAKHYKCDRCNRRLNTAGGLSVHMNQVHKENLTVVENSLPNRAAPDIEIFGMEGIPEDILQAHNQRISHEFFAAEAERRAISGNPAPGSGSGNQGGQGTKKAKFESPADIKKRLAEHKAKKAAAEAGGSVSSDPNTPAQTATPPVYQNPFPVPAPSAGSPAALPFPLPYGHPPASAASPPAPFYGAQPPPAYSYGEGYGGAPPPIVPGAFPPGQFPPQPHFSPAPQQHYGDPNAYPPPFSPYPAHHGAPHAAAPFNQYPPRQQSATPSSQPPQRQNSLPVPPGLPQRPTFNAPHVSREQLAEMHQGVNVPGEGQPQQFPSHTPTSGNAQSVDDLISNAAQSSVQAPAVQTPAAPTPAPPSDKPAPPEKNESKKSKKAIRLVFNENKDNLSPEEKMAMLPKYRYIPDKGGETVLAPIEAHVTGPVQDSDKVLDAQG